MVKENIEQIVKFVKEQFNNNDEERAIIEINNDINSIVTAIILSKALGKENVIGITMSVEEDAYSNDIKRISNIFNIKTINFDLLDIYNKYKKEASNFGYFMYDETKESNEELKSRMKMTTLYYLASLFGKMYNKNYKVVGTLNKDDLVKGNYTTGGENVSDISLLENFTLSEVIKLGQYFDIPNDILYKNLSFEEEIEAKYFETFDSSNNKRRIKE